MKHTQAPFIMLGDKKGKVYNTYHVKRSFGAVMRGSLKTIRSGGMKEIKRAGVPVAAHKLKPEGKLDVIPADFLIDENGIIVDIYQAKCVGHNEFMPWERIEAFIPPGSKCKCNTPDCLSPSCRDNCKKKMEMARECGIYCG